VTPPGVVELETPLNAGRIDLIRRFDNSGGRESRRYLPRIEVGVSVEMTPLVIGTVQIRTDLNVNRSTQN